ncbi:GDSL-type esterase/lipase family protein [Flavobacterium sp. DG1-102-2]|nr:GDSL-type esterase/lipase family protein [Flavobacterium sp. DG1-102-2]
MIIFFITSILSYTCTTDLHTKDKDIFQTAGRIEKSDNNSIILIGSASSVTFGFKGRECTVNLKASDTYVHHNYAVVEVDGIYHGREKIQPDGTPVNIKVKGAGEHIITIYKATEAANGNLIFTGAKGNLFKAKLQPKKKIEFIGDSITCGMGNDIKAIPCDTGLWFDQHNAYYSYAPIAARTLNADFVLSSVSGIGMYRNWNDEHDKEAIMPDVYQNLYLNKDNSKPYAFGFNPDITCIALGTNDFSEGDHKKERLPFNEDKYVANYVNFIKTVYRHSPKTQIVLLDSPMVNGEKSKTFAECLNKIKETINSQKPHKPVSVFIFKEVTPHGCGYHPEIEDDKLMASQLAPYLQTLLKK